MSPRRPVEVPVVREATMADARVLADVLARAFWDDPIQAWLVTNPRSRYSRLRAFFGVELATYLRHNVVLATEDLSAAALWARPDSWRTPWIEVVRGAPHLTRAFRSRMFAGLGLLTTMEAVHPTEPHWYLGVLGSDPSRRGSGAGAAVVRAVLTECDAAGLGAYLESSKPENVPYYERFGFRATGELSAKGSPPLIPMWRDPDPAP